MITIGDANPAASGVGHETTNAAGGQPLELGILTAIILVLVVSIALLRKRPGASVSLE